MSKIPLDYRMAMEDDSVSDVVRGLETKLGKLDLETVESYIKKNPNDVKGYATKAILLQHDVPVGIRFVEEAESQFGESHLLSHAKGLLYEKVGDRDKALDSFKRAIESNPLNIEARMSLATLLNRAKMYEEARKYWLQIIELSPEISVAWIGLARSEYSLGDNDRALKHLNAALFTVGDNREIRGACYNNRAEVHVAMNNLEGALADFDSAYRDDSKSAMSRLKKAANDAAFSHDFDTAQRLAEKLIQLQPNADGELGWYLNLGLLYGSKGQVDKIDRLFDIGINSGLSAVGLLDHKGMCFLRSGYLEKAIENYERLIDLSGNNLYSFNIIMTADALGDKQKASKHRRILKKYPALVAELISRYGPIAAKTIFSSEKKYTYKKKVGRDELCLCGSDKKYKNCHGRT